MKTKVKFPSFGAYPIENTKAEIKNFLRRKTPNIVGIDTPPFMASIVFDQVPMPEMDAMIIYSLQKNNNIETFGVEAVHLNIGSGGLISDAFKLLDLIESNLGNQPIKAESTDKGFIRISKLDK